MILKVLGIIVEYNPFHNGHIYHIQKAKEMTKCDYVIAVMSSSFVQRGEPAIIDKWTRSRLAVDFGVDLVIELPFVYSCQSADYFAKGAIDLLNAIGVTDLCFGSEDGHIETFIDIAKTLKDNQNQYDEYVKTYMQKGFRYPDACNQAISQIMQKEIKTPNDLLGLSYVKYIMNQEYSITPHCFQRTNNYHDTTLQDIASASAIRQALKSNQNIQNSLPHHELYQNDLFFLDDFFPYLRYQLFTISPSKLKQYHLVEEGMENALIKHIQNSHSMEEFINKLVSKRYTKPRIQRTIIHILMQNTKKEITQAMDIDYIRILAMNENGQRYLKSIKKTCPYVIVSCFSKYHHPALDIEYKATKLLSLLATDPQHFIKQEYTNIPYINKKTMHE